MTSSEQIRLLNENPCNISFHKRIRSPLCADAVDILQVNVGKRCNLSCRHCHVEAGPDRFEVMSREIFEKCLHVLRDHRIGTIDITGGAPEMNSDLPWFIREAVGLKRRLMVRSNLVILLEKPYEHFIDLYADNKVEIIASLPDYHEERVNRQRGEGAFKKILTVMRLLNARGYGKPGSGLVLDLVYNPVGTFLPGAQQALEHEYKSRLEHEHGVVFNTLYCLVNSPVGRYLDYLMRSENFAEYMHALHLSFNPSTLNCLMCRNTISVGWDGLLYDCDFNQMLGLTVSCPGLNHINNFEYDRLRTRKIVIGNHCFSCTAGAGSSCQGALEK
ncbi:MAG TPA: arsenosugar biosynthesis radical SAM (seleno)protein ArsS [Desulfomonilia bacterium]|nr:arsenosugar biosynthesis radical SAM (seleno)protein ArsS [Desulfomonilia bacterium]